MSAARHQASAHVDTYQLSKRNIICSEDGEKEAKKALRFGWSCINDHHLTRAEKLAARAKAGRS